MEKLKKNMVKDLKRNYLTIKKKTITGKTAAII